MLRELARAKVNLDLLVTGRRPDGYHELDSLVAFADRQSGALTLPEVIDGVILGGTELPLLLGAPRGADLPTLDTTELHVLEIIRRLEGGAA